MNQVETKQYKSIYHIFIWIGVFSLIMIGLLEWGYIVGGRAFGNYKVYTGLVPWCIWIVMTYLATYFLRYWYNLWPCVLNAKT